MDVLGEPVDHAGEVGAAEIEPEVEALFCEAGDPQSTAEQLLRLVKDAELADRLRHAAHQRVVRDYSETVVSDKLLYALENIKKYHNKYSVH